MKVGILTNRHERCGNAAYARDLEVELKKYFEVSVSDSPNDLFFIEGLKVVLINWHPARVGASKDFVDWWHSRGIKVVIIHQNSLEGPAPTEQVYGCDITVVHEEMGCYSFIPHGIHMVDGLPAFEKMAAKSVGTAGFPFSWKRFDVVAEVAKRFNVKCRIMAPVYEGVDTNAFVDGLRGHLGELGEINRDWTEVDDVIRFLARNTLNIFWYGTQSIGDQLGQSGSVRMGLAAKRPMIISTHRKFKTLLPYESELYIAETEQQVYDYAEVILRRVHDESYAPVKVPNRILKDMSWEATGTMYRNLIRELI